MAKPLKFDGEGALCPRCGIKSQLRKHKEIKQKQLSQPFYYSQWNQCENPNCLTTTFMEDKYKVENKNEANRELKIKQSLFIEDQNSLEFIRKISG